MSTPELRHAAATGDAWAIDQLIKRLQYKQQRFILRKQGQGRVIPRAATLSTAVLGLSDHRRSWCNPRTGLRSGQAGLFFV